MSQAAKLGPDERRVLAVLADRLGMGQRTYGLLNIAGDPRDWTREAVEEARDLAVYLAAELLRRGGAVPATERPKGTGVRFAGRQRETTKVPPKQARLRGAPPWRGTPPGKDSANRPSRRAARRELEAARVLGTRRVVHRSRYKSKPDVEPVTLPDGTVLQPEVKTRSALPKLVTNALGQARQYAPGAVPLAILSEKGGAAVAVLPLRDFVRLVGIGSAPAS